MFRYYKTLEKENHKSLFDWQYAHNLSSGYVEQLKFNRFIKSKKFNIETCDVCGLRTDIKRQLGNQDFGWLM